MSYLYLPNKRRKVLILHLNLNLSADAAQDTAQIGLLKGTPKFGEATRSYVQSQRRHAWRATFQGQVYNFLERPSGWKCIIYHVLV